MITIYQVVAEYGLVAEHLLHESAERHVDHAEQWIRHDKGEWLKIYERQIESWTDYIWADGYVIGYQFGQTDMGGQTFKRRITNLRYENDHIVGQATIKGRLCRVVHNPAAWMQSRRFDSQAVWEVDCLLD